MKHSIGMIFAAAVIILGAMDAMAIEEASYNVLKKDNHFEIRDYAPPTSLPKPLWKEILKRLETRPSIGFFATSPAATGQATKWR